jgi:tRNA 2-thiouridine synthesizing protein A
MSDCQIIDARNTFCPGPMMELIAGLKRVGVGEQIELLSSDKGSTDDIPAWTSKVGHQLVSVNFHGDHWSFVVKKMK